MNTSIETRKEELKNELNNLFESFKENTENLLVVASDWKVTDVEFTSSRATIHLTLVSDENRAIEIRYCKECGQWQKEEFSTNIAAMGSFDMLDGNGNANYYIAVGSLLTKKKMLSWLKASMKNFVGNAYELRREYNKLDEED